MSKEVTCLSVWPWGMNRTTSSSGLWALHQGHRAAAEGTKVSRWLKVWGTIADGEMLGEHNLFSVSERKVRGQLLRGSGHLPIGEQGKAERPVNGG